jgi:hypothetical protein
MIQLNTSGTANINPTDIDGGSSDACGIASFSVDQDSFNCSNVGSNTVTLTVTDVNGNSSSCIATVTVEDNIPPVAVCQDIIVQLDATGTIIIIGDDFDGGSSDACGIASFLVSPNTFDCSNVGPNSVIITATDVNGNSSSCTATVTVEDISPVVVCQDITIQLDAAGNVGINPTDIDSGSSDACGIASYSVDQDTFDCSNVGSNIVTLTVTDVNGNSSSCTATVTVEDITPPVPICQGGSFVLVDEIISPFTVDIGSSDTCGIASYTLSPNSFDCSNLGSNDVTLTVTDFSGNSSSCTSTVFVVDITRPILTSCQQADITVTTSNTIQNNCFTEVFYPLNVTGTDNCGEVTIMYDPPSGSNFFVGTTLVTARAIDTSGNLSLDTCTFNVTLIDDTPPAVVCQDTTIQLDAFGNASISITDVLDYSDDNCTVQTVTLDIDSFDCSNIGANTVTLTATDFYGNSGFCTATVTVEDDIAPVAVCQDITVQLDAMGIASIMVVDIDGGSSDICGIAAFSVSPNTFDCSNVGPNTVTLTVTNFSGYSSSCNATVTVEDLLEPEIICPADQTQSLGISGVFYEVPDYWATGEATATDNCSDAITIFSQDPIASSLLLAGNHIVTLTATDEYGNTVICDFELTVDDSTLGFFGNNFNSSSILMYPSPAQDIINISNPQKLNLQTAKIYDTTGRLIKIFNLKEMNTQVSLDISELSSATYIMLISAENGQITKQFIKE